VQTFAVHFNAISGSKWVDRLYEGDEPLKFREALALATAGVRGYTNIGLFIDIFVG
jgi:hypothetical protein